VGKVGQRIVGVKISRTVEGILEGIVVATVGEWDWCYSRGLDHQINSNKGGERCVSYDRASAVSTYYLRWPEDCGGGGEVGLRVV
jgi:hypothetical protein